MRPAYESCAARGYCWTASSNRATIEEQIVLEIQTVGTVARLRAVSRRVGAAARASTPRSSTGTRPDTLLLLEHQPVYTAGKRTGPARTPTDGTPVIDVDRGGKITWHGPGQLVGYPIVRLAEPIDVVAHVRRLEGLLIDVLRRARRRRRTGSRGAAACGCADARRPGAKIAAIGVRVQRGVTMHGFALNCDNYLAASDRIVPCGITDAGVTIAQRRSSAGRHRGRRRRCVERACSTRACRRPELASSHRRDQPRQPRGRRKLLRLEVRNAADADRAQAGVDQDHGRRWARSTPRCTPS